MTAGSLSCENIQVSFGGLKAVNGVSYDFKPGLHSSKCAPSLM